MHKPFRWRSAGVTLAATSALVLSIGAPATAEPEDDESPAQLEASEELREEVALPGLLRHITKFQQIAYTHGGNRAAGMPGYEASADYVASQLRAAGYLVQQREFEFAFYHETAEPVLKEVAPEKQTFTPGEDFETMTYSGAGTVTAPVAGVDLSLQPPRKSDSGCQASDFADFPKGAIALIQRGSCTFALKAKNAEAAGATGVIIFNQGNTEQRMDSFAGTLGGIVVDIPVVAASFAVGKDLADPSYPGTKVHMEVQTVTETRVTTNVIATTRAGNPNHVVMAGSHLDSVPEGPGINDNGSGSAALLEVALEIAEMEATPQKTIRFAWWGAEELGLIGSKKYVQSLTEEQLNNIDLYLNFDMIASPNYIFGVYDGDGSTFGQEGPEGSAKIEELFNSYYEAKGIPYQATPFNGRSDYYAFIQHGIPAGGLFTGAEGIKTKAEAETYGGVAGKQYDPCYHEKCDSLTPVLDGADPQLYWKLFVDNHLFGNISMKALRINADLIAHSVAVLSGLQTDD